MLEPVWTSLTEDPIRAALLVDFDGTLAPIVDEPAAATATPGVISVLGSLARTLGLVAVVSGRPVAFLRREIPDPAVVVIGHYGVEVDDGDGPIVDPQVARWAGAVAAAAADAEQRWPALAVERKGGIAATVHWRRAPEAAPSPEALADLAAAHGLAGQPGRLAYELRPPVAIDKGRAVTQVLANSAATAAAFVGDDAADVSAFAALSAWAGGAPDRTAVRVAVGSREAPAELLAAADLVVAGPEVLAAQLGAFAAALT